MITSLKRSSDIIVSGVGCCLLDILYNNINFSNRAVSDFFSKTRGDGGLLPGNLVFYEDFIRYSEQPFDEILHTITHGKLPDLINVGGPSIVPLIHLAQMTNGEGCQVKFVGRGGLDENGNFLLHELKKTSVDICNYKLIKGITPSTVVLSDPNYFQGKGERIFINSIGVANEISPKMLRNEFFSSDIVVFGGTALVPAIHDQLSYLLKKAKKNGAITVVNTVYDFRSEKANPHNKWPLGKDDNSYCFIDLLIADHVEALRLSGTSNLESACSFFMKSGLSSFIVTNGAEELFYWSNGNLFNQTKLSRAPVSAHISEELEGKRAGDTTGCGDNFVGGVLFSMVQQLKTDILPLNIMDSISWGVVSGGYTCFYIGGTYHEKESGEKLNKIKPYFEQYKAQIEFDPHNIVIFGAGKIGRSFIGQLFGCSGYGVIFIDVDEVLVDYLNAKSSYRVIIKGQQEDEINVPNVRAIHASDIENIKMAIAKAGIVSINVGKNALLKVIPSLAEGIKLRYQLHPNSPLDIILAENMRNASAFVKNELVAWLPEAYPLDSLIGLVETSIGKMVPFMTRQELAKDPLMVYAEPYNDLILDQKGFKSTIPDVKGLCPKKNIEAWVDRKAFIHNLGHAAAAYYGNFLHPETIFLFELLEDTKVYSFTREVMIQSSEILSIVYPDDFTFDELVLHTDDLLERFRNQALKDTVYRVGTDLKRKLGAEDRFLGITRLAIDFNIPFDKILRSMSYGFHFRAMDEFGKREEDDILFIANISKDFAGTLENDLKLDPISDRHIINSLNSFYIEHSKNGTIGFN